MLQAVCSGSCGKKPLIEDGHSLGIGRSCLVRFWMAGEEFQGTRPLTLYNLPLLLLRNLKSAQPARVAIAEEVKAPNTQEVKAPNLLARHQTLRSSNWIANDRAKVPMVTEAFKITNQGDVPVVIRSISYNGKFNPVLANDTACRSLVQNGNVSAPFFTVDNENLPKTLSTGDFIYTYLRSTNNGFCNAVDYTNDVVYLLIETDTGAFKYKP